MHTVRWLEKQLQSLLYSRRAENSTRVALIGADLSSFSELCCNDGLHAPEESEAALAGACPKVLAGQGIVENGEAPSQALYWLPASLTCRRVA